MSLAMSNAPSFFFSFLPLFVVVDDDDLFSAVAVFEVLMGWEREEGMMFSFYVLM